MPLPTFEPVTGARVCLRSVMPDDLPALMLVNGDPEVTRFLPYPAWQSPAEGEAWLARMDKLVAEGGAHQLVVHHRAEAQAVGTVLLFRHDEASARLELGYALARRFWRQGIAYEALTLAIDAAFGALRIRRIEAEVNVANTASNALLSRLGFVREGTLRERWCAKGVAYSVHFHGLLAREWMAASRG